MCVTAHPDDEAGGFGGTLRLYAGRGVETEVLCLTPGQAASHRGSAKDDNELAAMRRKELTASCQILGVKSWVVLDYPDGNLYRQDLYRVVCDLVLQIRKFRPQVLLTFGPEGGFTAHQDHGMASVFASLAFQWAAQNNRYPDQVAEGLRPHQTQKLYYQTGNLVLPNRPPVALPPITTVLDIGENLETKIAAFKAHATQQPLWSLFESNIRPQGKKECFHLAAQSTFRTLEGIEHDLFEGVVSD